MMNVLKVIIVITKNEVRNENLINYYITAVDKHFVYNYHHYCEIDKKKIVNCTINDHITVIYKIIDLDLIIAKSF